MQPRIFLISIVLAILAAPAGAQLGLPGVNLPPSGTVLDPVTGQVTDGLEGLSDRAIRQARQLANLRERRIDRLVRRNRDLIEFDARGAPARRGELLVLNADEASLQTVRSLGFRMIATEVIAGLEIKVSRIAPPKSVSLAKAQELLGELAPDLEVSADNLHFQSGEASTLLMMAYQTADPINTAVGIIDGGSGNGLPSSAQRGFAKGAPQADDHGSSVVSLLQYAGVRNLRLADVYGTDVAGGNALAIARAIGWLANSGSKVINVSLVGPENSLVKQAIERVQNEGVVVVAAVGNDGPAAPPAYPASFAGVVAVTAVDKRNRALIEAGRAKHLDYAGPGADIYGQNASGKMVKLRGTSFATPLVAARLAAAIDREANWRSVLDAEAQDLGKKGPDITFGRGLLCGFCRPGKEIQSR